MKALTLATVSSPFYKLPTLPAIRSSWDSPRAMVPACLAVGWRPEEIAAAWLHEWSHHQEPAVRSAIRSADLGTDDDAAWVQAQLDKRHRYYRSRVVPLLAEQRQTVDVGILSAILERLERDEPMIRIV